MLKTNYERPFTICPVSDIRRIVSEGIYCINDSNVKVQLRWPSKSLLKEDYRAEWLHSELLEISEEYREHYDFLIHVWHLHEKQVDEIKEPTMFRFMFFLNEEKNIHRLMLQRLSFYNHFFMDFNANDSFDTIAIFRVLEELHRNFVDETLKNEKCLICLDGLNFGERYSKWPCQSLIPHRFHFECMLKWLRTNNRCPLCQQPAKLFLNSNN
uniref:RING-type domain-containing protein n=1 Tax=Panagrolaimus sp. PS1159 TaxID=55785 RepID=A0AC35GWS5_9BILA